MSAVTLDPGFDGDGRAFTTWDGLSDVRKVVVQPDGKIVAAGEATVGQAQNVVGVVRYNADGTPDNNFGQGGRIALLSGSGVNSDGAVGLALQSNGGILVGGGPNAGIKFWRLDGNGHVDSNFGTGGVATAPGALNLIDLLIQSDGKIVAVANTGFVTGTILARFTSAGKPDAGFGTGGESIPLAAVAATDGALGPGDRIVVSGRSGSAAAARFTAGGVLDTSFDGDGVAALPNTNRAITSVAVQKDGRILLGGLYYFASPASDMIVERLDSSGGPDPNFGLLGENRTNFGNGGTDCINALEVQSDGKIVAAGFTESAGQRDFAMIRLATNGLLDGSFGTGGKISTDMSNLGRDEVKAMALTPTAQDIVLAGFASPNGKSAYAVARYLNNLSSSQRFTGTIIGTAGSYNNNGNTRDKAFDGNVNTYFDAPVANKDDAWVGLDLGFPKVLKEVRFAPRPGFEGRMIGGKIQASNHPDFTNGVALMYIVNSAPASGVITIGAFSNPAAYRYVRYLAPAGAYGNVAEMQFWGTTPPKLSGNVIGTSGSYNNNGNTRDKVFDGVTSSFFDAPAANKDNAWVGLDLGSSRNITRIRFTPRANFAQRMIGGRFQGSNTADFSSGVVDLLTITSTPTSGWNELDIKVLGNTFRYVRYLAPAGSYGNVAEIEFYGT